jgi:hypothetical protein
MNFVRRKKMSLFADVRDAKGMFESVMALGPGIFFTLSSEPLLESFGRF